MRSSATDAEERYRRFLDGRGDDPLPLVSFLGEGGGARARTRAEAALLLCNVYLDKGSFLLARGFVRLAALLFREAGERRAPAECWTALARIYESTGRAPKARRLLERAAREIGLRSEGLEEGRRQPGGIAAGTGADPEPVRAGGTGAGRPESREGAVDYLVSGCPVLTGDERFRELIGRIREASGYGLPVLLEGESGVGKDLVARLVHRWSGRGGPFAAVNLAAVSRDLFESTLFGHARGAFTGAVCAREGIVGAAGKGTIFLDEIGELDPALQAKLLRFLQDGEYMAVGDARVRRSEAQVVAATNRDLAAAVEAGSFRADLYHRLSVLSFRLPALRERRGDIPLLAAHFLLRACERFSLGPLRLSDAAARRLAAYGWPGNVRELENEMLRAALAARRGHVGVWHLSDRLLGSVEDAGDGGPGASLDARLGSIERREIVEALSRHGGNRTRAASSLGVKRTSLLYRMKRLGID